VPQTLSTGCNELDQLLGGGIKQGEITLFYGEAATGKTTICIQTAISVSTRRMKVLFIDSDNSFSQERFHQIAGVDSRSLSELIILFFPDTFERQRTLVESLDNYVTPKLGLIIIDSMSTLYRAAFSKAVSTFHLNRELTGQLACLADLTRSKEIACIITSQVHARLNGVSAQIEPVASRAVFHFSSTIIRIRNTPKPKVREFSLERLRGDDTRNGRRLVNLSERGFT